MSGAEFRGRRAAGVTTRRELVENELLEHATRLFAERGFAGTSLQDIADALGITRPALYYYVKSKDELLAKLVTEVTNGPLDELDALAARADVDAVAKLRGVVEIIAGRRVTQPEQFRLLIRSEAELPAELTEAYAASRRDVLRTIAGVVEEGVRAGLFRPVDARVAALGVLGMCNWVAWWFHPGGRDSGWSVVSQLADMAVGALARPDAQTLDGEGPAAALKMLRQDLDHLERVLDL
ncbi:TetR family transcriptional regulator [Pseudonocardia sulfidoxydans NBRC 16205]|uniref:TetR family transcriptional regulator n=1 Tax=Pseudonocardia sulfidoxydans NBRC 16205 TaxID=1223511 RepID=A0A511D8L3_9PSEU|nr:TetR/AcrR family transcriptional regulator [Pseudonocardia sulfidoxydans]GEL21126.1 TetR family transcriptional regulator [Pseudonocardia sulfidoxydans NBRC 16205]